MWLDRSANERQVGHAATFCSAANGPVLPILLSLGWDRGQAHSGGTRNK
jgi:hypothetical protein